MLKPSEIRKGSIYKTEVRMDFGGVYGSETYDYKELCIGKNKDEICFFLLDELPNFDKANMREIMKLTVKQLCESEAYDIDEDIDEQIVICDRKKEHLLTPVGDKKFVIKKFKRTFK